MKRRFEFSKGSSNKFWDVVVNGVIVTISFGKIGTSGQEQRKVFDDGPAAQQHAEKMIAQKLGKGYAECQA